MNRSDPAFLRRYITSLVITSLASGMSLAETPSGTDDVKIEEIIVTARARLLGFGEAHANNTIELETMQLQTPGGDVLNFINRLPGVNISHTDNLGGNDWSSRITIRGMSNGRGDGSIGFMVDGMPTGSATYGGGSKPNRYIDSENVVRINVGQNTSDISSAANGSLGGTIRYYTADPDQEFGVSLAHSIGSYDQHRTYFRADSGEILPGLTSYLSYSTSGVESWMGDHSGQFDRDHVDVKIVKEFDDGLTIKLRGSYNYRNENDYDSVKLHEFKQDPTTDYLTDVWTPETQGSYRPTWGGTRWDNSFSMEISKETDSGNRFKITPYYHKQQGWGWFAPPDQRPRSGGYNDIEGSTAGPRLYYANTYLLDANGAFIPAPSPIDLSAYPCLAGGRSDPSDFEINPAFDCDTAERIGSRRRSGYWNDRIGVTAETLVNFANHAITVGGWFEYQDRHNDRTWYVTDPSDPATIKPRTRDAYWLEFDRNYETTSTRFYIQDAMDFGQFRITAGLVWHKVASTFSGRLTQVESDQNRDTWLPKLGAVYTLNDNSEVFASYSRNINNLAEGLLRQGNTDLLDPEISDNYDIGYRWNTDRMGLVAQVFSQRFSNRLGRVATSQLPDADFFAEDPVQLLNIGGVENNGLDVAVSYDLTNTLGLYVSYSYLDATYSDDVPEDNIRSGENLINIPENQFFGEVVWSPEVFGQALRLALNAKFVGDRVGKNAVPDDNLDEEIMDSYTLVGFDASYAITNVPGVDQLKLQFNVSNLLDEEYLAGTDGDNGGNYFIGGPRTASFTIRADF